MIAQYTAVSLVADNRRVDRAMRVVWVIVAPEAEADVSFATFKEKGICRVAIHDGKLMVLYPDYNKN